MEELIKVEYDNLEMVGIDGGGEPIFNYKGEPFTGLMIDYEDDETLALECEYQNGYLEGWCRYYYSNGNIQKEYQIHNNIVVEGTFKKWKEDGSELGGF